MGSCDAGHETTVSEFFGPSRDPVLALTHDFSALQARLSSAVAGRVHPSGGSSQGLLPANNQSAELDRLVSEVLDGPAYS